MTSSGVDAHTERSEQSVFNDGKLTNDRHESSLWIEQLLKS